MGEKTVENWTATRIRKSLHREIEKVLESSEAQANGMTNVAQFVDISVREMLTKVKSNRLSHLNMYDDHVKIVDNELGRIGRIVSVYFKIGEKSWCDFCNEGDCLHVQYAWELPEVRRILLNRGMIRPESNNLRQ